MVTVQLVITEVAAGATILAAHQDRKRFLESVLYCLNFP